MVARLRYAAVCCVAILALAVAAPRSSAQYATEIALTGVTIPGSSGNAFNAFEIPDINNVGQVAFLGLFPGGQGIFSVTGHPVNTIPSSTDNSLNPNLRTQGATFPSAPLLNSIALSGNFAANGSGILSTFNNQVALNNTSNGSTTGQMAYIGNFNNSLQGVFAATDPSILTPNTIALTNTPAAGFSASSGVLYTSLANPPALNDNNNLLYVASLSNGGQALYFSSTSGAPSLVAVTGSTAPGAAGNTFFTFTGPTQLVSIPSGGTDYFAFQAGIFNSVSGIFSSAIFAGTNSSFNIVAQTGTQANTLPAGYQYQNFMDPVSLGAANNGQVAFRANLINTNPGATDAIAAGLFVASNGAAPVCIGATNTLIGTPLPSGYSTTFPFGATYNGFGGVSESLDGQVAFVATLAPSNSVSGGAGGGGIFLSKNQSTNVSPIAVSGDIAPGTGGASYSSFFNDTNSTFNPIFNDTSIAINNHIGTNSSHEVAFQAYLAGAGVNGSNNQALFIGNGQPLPGTTNRYESAILARTGEQLTVSPGVTETISSFMGFNTGTGNGANSFNDLGELAVTVNFLEGGSGVYVFTPDLHLSPFTVTNSMTAISWGTAGQANSSWTFAYSPANQVYRVIIDPADVGLASITVNGPTANQSIPALQVSSNTGIANLVLQNGVTLTLGGGAITGGINVLTIQGPSSITTSSGTATLKLLGDVTSLAASGTVSNAGSFTATIAANFDLGNAPFPATAPNFTTPPASTADVDRFRTFNVARGNFLGPNNYPVDLLITGNISSPSETITLSDGTTATNDVHRGLLKAGPGILRLTGTNTFGPDTSIKDDPYTVNPPSLVSYVQSIEVTGGLLSFANDSNLGAIPSTSANTTVAFVRWITLNGGGIGLETTATSTLANPTVITASRGIALGPVTGFGGGSIDVNGTNVLDYEGVVSDNSNGITTGVGSLTKTGTGTLILSGAANTYRGGTFVNQGTLIVPSDGSLGAAGSPVTASAAGTLAFTGTTTTTRSFTMNNGTISVAAAKTLTFNGSTVSGANLGGAGAFATSAAGSQFLNVTSQPSVAIISNSANDQFINFNNSASFTLAAGVNTAGTLSTINFNGVINQGLGNITIGAGSQLNVANFQTYGNLTLTPASVAGQFTELANLGTTPLGFNAGSQTFVGSALAPNPNTSGMDLMGQNLQLTGGLFVNNGSMFSSVAGSTIFVNYGATYKGAGSTNVSIVTQNGGKLLFGNCPGVATFGSLVLGTGGINNLEWEINDAGPSAAYPNAPGVAGPTANLSNRVSGWSLGQAAVLTPRSGTPTYGNLTWTATPSSPFGLDLETLLGPSTLTGTNPDGPMADFDPTQSYTWPIITYQGTYSGPTSDAMLTADTLFDQSLFANALPGGADFSLHLDQYAAGGGELDLIYSPSPVPEPGTLALIGAAAVLGWRWRPKNRANVEPSGRRV